jgi:hypothetical protein
MALPVLGTSWATVPSVFASEMPSDFRPETKASTGVPEGEALGDGLAVAEVLTLGLGEDRGVGVALGVGLAVVLPPVSRMKRK